MTDAEQAAALKTAEELETIGNAMWKERRGELRCFDGFQVEALEPRVHGEAQFAAVLFGGAFIYGPAQKILDGFAEFLAR